MTPREFILSRFRTAAARKNGGVTTRAVYSGAHSFALAILDAELDTMRREGLLGFAQGLWFLRGGGIHSRNPARETAEGSGRPAPGPEAKGPIR